eukprot:scaffold9544_cov97-Cylindrotheca_fusiformis.AAC.8
MLQHANLYPCFADQQVFSIPTACEEILRTCFTTERNSGVHNDDDENGDSDTNSITSNTTPKTSNSVSPPKNRHKPRNHRRLRHSPWSLGPATNGSSNSSHQVPMTSREENYLAELQYKTNQNAQRIQRSFEKQSDKCAQQEKRHLYERYGNKIMCYGVFDAAINRSTEDDAIAV